MTTEITIEKILAHRKKAETDGGARIGWDFAAAKYVDFLLERFVQECSPEAIATADLNASPWPLPAIVWRLANAVDHLLHDHDCDAHGHEGVLYAMQAARSWLDAQPGAVPRPHERSGSDCHADANAPAPASDPHAEELRFIIHYLGHNDQDANHAWMVRRIRCVLAGKNPNEAAPWQESDGVREPKRSPADEIERLRNVIRIGGAMYRAERAAMGIPAGHDPNQESPVRDLLPRCREALAKSEAIGATLDDMIAARMLLADLVKAIEAP